MLKYYGRAFGQNIDDNNININNINLLRLVLMYNFCINTTKYKNFLTKIMYK